MCQKELPREIAALLARVCNYSFSSGMVLCDWQVSKIISVSIERREKLQDCYLALVLCKVLDTI